MNPQIWAARKAKKLSQTELAERAGNCDQKDISRIENEGWIPPTDIRQSISDALDVPVDELFPVVQDRAS